MDGRNQLNGLVRRSLSGNKSGRYVLSVLAVRMALARTWTTHEAAQRQEVSSCTDSLLLGCSHLAGSTGLQVESAEDVLNAMTSILEISQRRSASIGVQGG